MLMLNRGVLMFIGMALLLAAGACSDSSKREMTRITGETIRNACGNWDRCTVKCEKPDPYTGACPAVTTPDGSKDE